MKGELASHEYPYPLIWCDVGHWDGLDPDDESPEDPWVDCPDFEESSGD